MAGIRGAGAGHWRLRRRTNPASPWSPRPRWEGKRAAHISPPSPRGHPLSVEPHRCAVLGVLPEPEQHTRRSSVSTLGFFFASRGRLWRDPFREPSLLRFGPAGGCVASEHHPTWPRQGKCSTIQASPLKESVRIPRYYRTTDGAHRANGATMVDSFTLTCLALNGWLIRPNISS